MLTCNTFSPPPGIIAAVILGIILIILLFLRQRILIAISLIKEASK